MKKLIIWLSLLGILWPVQVKAIPVFFFDIKADSLTWKVGDKANDTLFLWRNDNVILKVVIPDSAADSSGVRIWLDGVYAAYDSLMSPDTLNYYLLKIDTNYTDSGDVRGWMDGVYVNEGQSNAITAIMIAFNYASSSAEGGKADSAGVADTAAQMDTTWGPFQTYVSNHAGGGPADGDSMAKWLILNGEVDTILAESTYVKTRDNSDDIIEGSSNKFDDDNVIADCGTTEIVDNEFIFYIQEHQDPDTHLDSIHHIIGTDVDTLIPYVGNTPIDIVILWNAWKRANKRLYPRNSDDTLGTPTNHIPKIYVDELVGAGPGYADLDSGNFDHLVVNTTVSLPNNSVLDSIIFYPEFSLLDSNSSTGGGDFITDAELSGNSYWHFYHWTTDSTSLQRYDVHKVWYLPHDLTSLDSVRAYYQTGLATVADNKFALQLFKQGTGVDTTSDTTASTSWTYKRLPTLDTWSAGQTAIFIGQCFLKNSENAYTRMSKIVAYIHRKKY